MKTREELREKGQFWTPAWVAESMVRYALGNGSDHVFDPAHGMGAFFVAAKKLEGELKRKISLFGTDIDTELVKEIENQKILETRDLKNLLVQDFIEIALRKKYKSIVVNPPYIRHHRISLEKKLALKKIAIQHIGQELDGRAGLHVYFLILSLLSLESEGRLSFIVSSDICEGVFANPLWQWIAKHYQIESILTFSGKASPFPGIDTNPIIFFIKNSSPKNTFSWARLQEKEPEVIKNWVESGFDISKTNNPNLIVFERTTEEGLRTGFSRTPQTKENKFTLGDFAYSMRGIATGNNNYFLLGQETIEKFKIPNEYLVPAIGRTRDITSDIIDQNTFDLLRKKGRPHHLLYINNEKLEDLPDAIRNYIAHGEQLGVHKTPLILARKTWYKMERRNPPPILFSYLGRRSSRFLLNKVGVLPLNGFLCIYLKKGMEPYLDKLIEIINHEEVLKNLFLVGKSYGSDAVKVEPRAIERLPIPDYLIKKMRLDLPLKNMLKQKVLKL